MRKIFQICLLSCSLVVSGLTAMEKSGTSKTRKRGYSHNDVDRYLSHKIAEHYNDRKRRSDLKVKKRTFNEGEKERLTIITRSFSSDGLCDYQEKPKQNLLNNFSVKLALNVKRKESNYRGPEEGDLIFGIFKYSEDFYKIHFLSLDKKKRAYKLSGTSMKQTYSIEKSFLETFPAFNMKLFHLNCYKRFFDKKK